MDYIISKLREFSLRNLILIFICVDILEAVISISTDIVTVNGFRLSLILGQLNMLVFISGFAAHALNDTKQVKTILVLAILGFILAIFGMYGALDIPFISGLKIRVSELMQYYIEQTITYIYIQNLLYTIVYLLGFHSLKESYRIPWIIFTSISIIDSIFFSLYLIDDKFSNRVFDFPSEVAVAGLLVIVGFIVGLIILLVKGGKKEETEKK